MDTLQYTSVHFSKEPAGHVNRGIEPAQLHKHKEGNVVKTVEYATVIFNGGSVAPRYAASHTVCSNHIISIVWNPLIVVFLLLSS